MATAIILVAVTAGAAALVWLIIARRRRPVPFDLGMAEPEADAFALQPESLQESRPPRIWSVIRIVFAIAFVAALVAGLAWTAGYLINEQLARMLVE